MQPRSTPLAAAASRGSSLIEVLVAMLLFAVGVLGLVALQALSIRVATQSEDRSRAALLANELVTQMWASRSRSPDAATIASWKQRIANARVAGLPEGTGSVETDADGVTTITIRWKSPGRADSEPESRYATQVAMP